MPSLILQLMCPALFELLTGYSLWLVNASVRGHVSASISEIIMALKCLYASPICISIRNSSNVSGRSNVCAVCVNCVFVLCLCVGAGCLWS